MIPYRRELWIQQHPAVDARVQLSLCRRHWGGVSAIKMEIHSLPFSTAAVPRVLLPPAAPARRCCHRLIPISLSPLQHALMGTLSASAASPSAVAALNARATALSRYHAHTSAMELAYRCRDAPLLYRGRVDVDEELGGLCLRLYTDRGRFRIPLSDSYLAEPLTGALREGWEAGGHGTGEIVLELWGVLKRGRTQLRVRLPRVPDPPPADATLPTAPSVRSTPSADSARRLVCAALGLSPDADMPADARPLLEKKHKKLSFILEDISSLRAKQIAGDTLQVCNTSRNRRQASS